MVFVNSEITHPIHYMVHTNCCICAPMHGASIIWIPSIRLGSNLIPSFVVKRPHHWIRVVYKTHLEGWSLELSSEQSLKKRPIGFSRSFTLGACISMSSSYNSIKRRKSLLTWAVRLEFQGRTALVVPCRNRVRQKIPSGVMNDWKVCDEGSRASFR